MIKDKIHEDKNLTADKHLNVKIDPLLLKNLKQYCLTNDMSLRAAVTDFLKHMLKI